MKWEIIEKLKYFFTLSSEKIHITRELILIFKIFLKKYIDRKYTDLEEKKLVHFVKNLFVSTQMKQQCTMSKTKVSFHVL